MNPYTIDASTASEYMHLLGGKAKSLALLSEANINIPAWFVLGPKAFFDSVDPEALEACLAQDDPEQVDAFFEAIEFRRSVQDALRKAIAKHRFETASLAVRSSGRLEDSHKTSFAGIYHTDLCVSVDGLFDSIKRVWRAAFSQRVLEYSRIHNISTYSLVPSVLIQTMVKADMAGICFSADPIHQRRDHILIAATFGLAMDLANGSQDADMITVNPQLESIEYQVAQKTHAYCCIEGQLMHVPVEERLIQKPVLNQQQIKFLSNMAKYLEYHFGCPQDIEWAIENNKLYILQSRPITAFDKIQVHHLWQNEGLEELWPGLVEPMTYSFVRQAYETGYGLFLRTCGIIPEKHPQLKEDFKHLLGLIQGRLFWNQSRMDSIFRKRPLFSAIQLWLHYVGPEHAANSLDKTRYPKPTWMELAMGILHGWQIHKKLPGLCAQTHQTLQQRRRLLPKLNPKHGPSDQNPHQLVHHLKGLTETMAQSWHVPILVAHCSAIWFDALKAMCYHWINPNAHTLASDLLCHDPNRVSLQQTLAMEHLAKGLSHHPSLIQYFRTKNAALCDKTLYEYPELYRQFHQYLNQYGETCDTGFLFEQPSLIENPLPLMRSLGEWAHRLHHTEIEDKEGLKQPMNVRVVAEDHVFNQLKDNVFRQQCFRWVIHQTRWCLNEKEQLHQDLCRLMTQVRWTVLALANHLKEAGQLTHINDVFYLTIDELINFVEGNSVDNDLKGLVKQRKKAYTQYGKDPEPSPCFQTKGMVYVDQTYQNPWIQQLQGAPTTNGDGVVVPRPPEAGPTILKGLSCFPGKLQGVIRLIDAANPPTDMPKSGEILLVKQGHPGLIHLFPNASGLILEHGSPLSHVAILAREIGLPTMVSVKQATTALHEGDIVEFDSHQGTIKVIGQHP